MIVLIPAYEPTEKMLVLIRELKSRTDYKILVIDDGSGSRFKELFDKAVECGCIVLRHPQNRGKGEALKTGFNYIRSECDPDKVVCADSDGQHSVDDIIKLADNIDESKPEMVLGVREFKGTVPFKSRFGNSISALVFKLATGIILNDTQTGLRGYPYKLMPWLCSIEGERFEYELNLLLRSKAAGISIKQLTIATIYENNNNGTHFRPIHDSISVLMPIFKFCSSSLLAFGIDFILFFLVNRLTSSSQYSLLYSVVIARVISSTFNYFVNKIFVFDEKEASSRQSAPKYFGLVLVIMALNLGLMEFLTGIVCVPKVLAKILTEATLFTMSYTIQRLFIFNKDDKITLTPLR